MAGLPQWAADRLRALRKRLQLEDPRRLLGVGFVLAVSLIWVAASFLVQGLEGGEAGVHPAVLTYFANSLFAVCLPIHWAVQRIRGRSGGDVAAQERSAILPPRAARSDADDAPPATLAADDSKEPQQVAKQQLLRAAMTVAPLWYLAQLAFNMSLAHTSVTSNTILSSTAALFAFGLAVLLLGEAFALRKLGFILLLIAGTALVTLADSRAGDSPEAAHESVEGDLLCLVSAVLYAAYTVAIRKLLGEDEETPMALFFGYMGCLIFCCVGPVLLVLSFAGVHLGALTPSSFGLVVAKGLLDNVLSDYLWARAILLLGPTIATAGLSMQVPLAVGLDAVFGHPPWLHEAGTAVMTFLGGGAVLAGFLGVNIASGDDEREHQREWEARQRALQSELEFDPEEVLAGEALAGGGSKHGSSGALRDTGHDRPGGSAAW